MANLRTTRRSFLRLVAGGTAAGAVRAFGAEADLPPPGRRKLIVVVFGGGVRSSETIADPAHQHIPKLWKEMVPRGTLWSNMRVEHLVVHPNCTGSIHTGHWEWDDLDWSKPPAHPTTFEIFRKARGAPDTAAWAFVYASILERLGESTAAGYGQRFAANVVQPPTIPRRVAEEMDRRIARAAAGGSAAAGLEAAGEAARQVRAAGRADTAGLRSPAAREWFNSYYETWRRAEGTTSHDAFLTEAALACMSKFAPGVLTVAMGEIDSAHYGSWSRYVEAIRRTDELTWRLWRASEELPEYRGRTLMLVLPDHGRQLETPGGPGFIHHSDFYTGEGADEGCRRVWMLAIGPGVAAGRTIDRPTPITAGAATGLQFLGLRASPGAAPPAVG